MFQYNACLGIERTFASNARRLGGCAILHLPPAAMSLRLAAQALVGLHGGYTQQKTRYSVCKVRLKRSR